MSLYDYQKTGVAFLAARTRAYLADTMGLGKTIQAASAARQLWDSGAIPQIPHIVVVCPASTRVNWEREWETWGCPGKVDIISYASRELKALAERGKPHVVILDEAHYVKNPSAKRTRNALTLARRSKYAWLLSGTPMPNHPGELYTPFKYLWPEALQAEKAHTYARFIRRFCKVHITQWGEKPYAAKNADVLYGMIRPVMLRRTLDGVGLDLPPLRVTRSWLRRKDVDQRILTELEERVSLDEMDAQEYTSTVRRMLGNLKALPVARVLVEEYQDGQWESIVVMAHHRGVLDALQAHFEEHGMAVCRLDGSTPAGRRQGIVDAFNAGEAEVFLGQQTASGVGINLQSASEIVLVEPDWTPDGNWQAIKRIHRIGQDSPCRARIFTVAETLDEHIINAIHRKTEMQEAVGVRGNLT
jgi:SNF2 family DNA or RNA helicase